MQQQQQQQQQWEIYQTAAITRSAINSSVESNRLDSSRSSHPSR
jgi:hypothetical protein